MSINCSFFDCKLFDCLKFLLPIASKSIEHEGNGNKLNQRWSDKCAAHFFYSFSFVSRIQSANNFERTDIERGIWKCDFTFVKCKIIRFIMMLGETGRDRAKARTSSQTCTKLYSTIECIYSCNSWLELKERGKNTKMGAFWPFPHFLRACFTVWSVRVYVSFAYRSVNHSWKGHDRITHAHTRERDARDRVCLLCSNVASKTTKTLNFQICFLFFSTIFPVFVLLTF